MPARAGIESVDIVNTNYGRGGMIYAPSGALRIAAVLRDIGFEVRFRDYQLYVHDRKPDPAVFANYLGGEADVLALSVQQPQLPTVLGAVERLRRDGDTRCIVLGGSGVSGVETEILRAYPVDHVVSGEGEDSARELFTALKDGRSGVGIPGVYSRTAGVGVRYGGDRSRIVGPWILPAWDLVNFDDYGGTAVLVTARGCPHQCSFCAVNSIWGRKVTLCSVDQVVREVELVLSLGARDVAFFTDTFTAFPRQVEGVCAELKLRRLDVPWTASARVGKVGSSLLATMADAGCWKIFLGLESGDQAVLHRIGKEFTVAEGRSTVARARGLFEQVDTSYVYGFPFETYRSFLRTAAMIADDLDSPGVWPICVYLTPYPRTRLYREYRDTLEFNDDFLFGHMRLDPELSFDAFPEILSTAREHPEIFVCYQRYPDPDRHAKRDVLKKLGLDRAPRDPHRGHASPSEPVPHTSSQELPGRR